MHILLTNDDGYEAIGIKTLERALPPDVRVSVVAPHRGYSGCGHQVTAGPLKATELDVGRYRVEGTPADCVRLGLRALVADVDLVLCGVNQGANLGVDIYMSGTAAAAREAIWLGVPAVALSQYMVPSVTRDWERTREMTARVLRHLWNRFPSAGHFWNVNLPDGPQAADAVTLAETFPEPQHLQVDFEASGPGWILQGDYHTRPRTPGSDVAACFGGAISISEVSAGTHSPPRGEAL